ncbi:MAG: hypothetical protein AB7I30_02325 [Isosphaeraceae bacterium]
MRYVVSPGPRLRGIACVGLTCLALGSGCTHNHYYSYDPCATPAAIVPGTVQYGGVCEVPSRVISGPTVAGLPSVVDTPVVSAGTPIGARPKPPRIVVSEPVDRGRGFAWRPSDPEGGLATRVEGAYDDSSRTR